MDNVDSGGNDGPLALASCEDTTSDPFDVQGLVIEGDLLKVTVAYSGGCTEHEFSACWVEGSFTGSDPAQAELALIHEDHGDMCEAYLTEQIYVELTALEEAYEAEYGQSGTILITIKGTDRQVEHTF